jgi:arachidonate 15-lipoxygenase
MTPTLPQDDPTPAARAASLAAQGAPYAYDRSHMGALFVKEVPRGEGYDAAYVAAATAVTAKLLANRATQGTRSWPPRADDAEASKGPAALVDAVGRRVEATTNRLPPARPTDPSGYDDLYGAGARPPSFGRHDDAFFAWRQVAGATPITLRGLDAVPDNVPLDAATFARAVGDGDRLDAAVAEGRLFACDYAVLDGLEVGRTEGLTKYLYAPVALFVRAPDGALRPVGIQVTQRPEADGALWTPADGVAWRMARTVVNCAEMTINGAVAHFSLCHLLAETLSCVSRRTLAPAHPLLRLLEPHFRYTHAVNATARESLVNRGGKQETYLGPTLDAGFALAERVNASLRYDAVGARAELAGRRVDDPARLPVYPYRDDGAPLADAIDRWVDAYVRVYYASDEAARRDPELQAWAVTLAGDGGLRGVPALDGVAAVARFVSDLLWRITGFHAVINYAGWDYASWAPGMPSALFGPAPRRGATEDDWRAMLPPLSVANGMLEQMQTLHDIQLNRLGAYPAGHLDDPRVATPLARFQAELVALGEAVDAREATRPWPFPYLHPARVPNSIHV